MTRREIMTRVAASMFFGICLLMLEGLESLVADPMRCAVLSVLGASFAGVVSTLSTVWYVQHSAALGFSFLFAFSFSALLLNQPLPVNRLLFSVVAGTASFHASLWTLGLRGRKAISITIVETKGEKRQNRAAGSSWVPAVIRRRSREFLRGASSVFRISGDPREPVQMESDDDRDVLDSPSLSSRLSAGVPPAPSQRPIRIDYLSLLIDDGGPPLRVRGPDISNKIFSIPRKSRFRVELEFTLLGPQDIVNMAVTLTPGHFAAAVNRRHLRQRPEGYKATFPPVHSSGWMCPPLPPLKSSKLYELVLALGDDTGEVFELLPLKVKVVKNGSVSYY